MSPSRFIARSAAVLVLCGALAACGSKPVVGVLLATSGTIGSYGQAMRQGCELALEEARAKGELRTGFEAVYADSASDPETAIREYRRLAEEHGARMIIAGVTSGEAKHLLPVIDDTNTICLTPSASAPMLTKESKLFYRLFASDELEGRRAARFLASDQGKGSVLIYTGDTEQARGIEPPFRQVFEHQHEKKVVSKVLLTNPAWERESADIITAHNPESVYIIAYAEDTLEVLRHLRERTFEGLICVTSAFYSGEIIERVPELVEGIYFPQPAFDTSDEQQLVKDFVAAFEAKYDRVPDIYAAHAYDAMRLVIFIINETRLLETSEIKKTLSFGLQEFPGVTGIIQFNEWGDVQHNPIMFIIKDGEVQNYEKWLAAEKKRIHEEIRRLLSRGGR